MIEKMIVHQLWFRNSDGVDVEAKTLLNAIMGNVEDITPEDGWCRRVLELRWE